MFHPAFLFLLLNTLSTIQASSPTDPVTDCTNPNLQVVYTACSAGDYSKCCSIGTSCCAGGCCDLTSNCLFVGTSKEVCCDVSDPTICGTASDNPPAFAAQDVLCTGYNGLSSYFCPPGSQCSDDQRDTCIGGSSSGGSGGGGGGGSGASSSSSSSESVDTFSTASTTSFFSPISEPTTSNSESPVFSPTDSITDSSTDSFEPGTSSTRPNTIGPLSPSSITTPNTGAVSTVTVIPSAISPTTTRSGSAPRIEPAAAGGFWALSSWTLISFVLGYIF